MVNPFGGLIPSEQDQKMSFVSYEKRRALEQIDKDATNLLSERLKLGQNTPEFRQFMHDLTASDDAKRRALLTPEEYFQYQLRFSRTASGLAIGLELMNPTEQEYLGIFKLQAIPDTKWNGFDHLDDPGQRAEYAQDYVDVKERIKDFLGPARFADYQRSGDPAFQDLQRYVDREQLSSQQAIALYDLKQTASAAADQLKANPTGQYLTDYQKLEALRRETVRQITEKLGPSASDKYLQSSSAEWVHSLGTASVPDRTP